nr:unnamed protein product [Spirometra erinaceieuropaei]
MKRLLPVSSAMARGGRRAHPVKPAVISSKSLTKRRKIDPTHNSEEGSENGTQPVESGNTDPGTTHRAVNKETHLFMVPSVPGLDCKLNGRIFKRRKLMDIQMRHMEREWVTGVDKKWRARLCFRRAA